MQLLYLAGCIIQTTNTSVIHNSANLLSAGCENSCIRNPHHFRILGNEQVRIIQEYI